jgi:hypothetical protein
MCIGPNICFIFGSPNSNGAFFLKVQSFHQSLTLRQIREYVCFAKVFDPLAPILALLETIVFFKAILPWNTSLPCSNSLMEF